MGKAFGAVILLVGVGLACLSQETDWPMEGRDPGRSSFNPIAVTPPLEVAWEVPLFHSVETIVAAGDTVVAVAGGVHEVVTLAAGTGQERWRFRVPEVKGAFRSTPAIWDGLVIVGGQLSDVLYALDLESGEVRWRRAGFGNLYADPCVTGDLLLVASPVGLFALEAANGELGWWAELRAVGGPAAAGGLVFALVFGGELAAISLSAGKEAWRARRAWSGSASDPVVVDDLVALVSGDTVRFWDRTTGWSWGKVLLPYGQPSGTPFHPATADGQLFVPLTDGERSWLVAVDPGAGRVRWTYALPGILRSPCVTGEVVYVAAGNLLLCLDGETAEVLWQREFPGDVSAGPIAAGRGILCAFGDTVYKLVPQR